MDPSSLWSLFRKIDKSRDGTISVKELKQARKRGDLEISPAEAKALMKFGDEDDNGNKMLTFASFFVACTGQQLDPSLNSSLLRAFTDLDVNNDGYVDRKDLMKAAQAGLKISKSDMNAFMKAADADGDKRISLIEYAGVFAVKVQTCLSRDQEIELRQQFALLDRNGDGYISRSELRAVAQTMPYCSKLLMDTFAAADLDGDGSISFEEFINQIKGEGISD